MTGDHKQEKPTRKQQEQARHRREILQAAVGLFADQGYHQTTMQMIADRAGFSVGYLYKHFPGKEEMYRELLGFHLARMETLIYESVDSSLSPLEEIRRSLTMVCDHFNQHPQFMRIYHQEIGQETSELLKRKGKHHERLTGLITSAQEQGDLKPCDPDLLATAIQGAAKELFHELADRGGERPFASLPDVLFELLIDPQRT